MFERERERCVLFFFRILHLKYIALHCVPHTAPSAFLSDSDKWRYRIWKTEDPINILLLFTVYSLQFAIEYVALKFIICISSFTIQHIRTIYDVIECYPSRSMLFKCHKTQLCYTWFGARPIYNAFIYEQIGAFHL